MRKKTISHIIDCSFWALIALLPLVAYVVILWHSGVNGIDLSSVMSRCGFSLLGDNIVVNTMSQLFGSSGVMPFFVDDNLIVYLSYFVIVEIIHLAVDVLLFIPRFAHKFFSCEKNGGVF